MIKLDLEYAMHMEHRVRTSFDGPADAGVEVAVGFDEANDGCAAEVRLLLSDDLFDVNHEVLDGDAGYGTLLLGITTRQRGDGEGRSARAPTRPPPDLGPTGRRKVC